MGLTAGKCPVPRYTHNVSVSALSDHLMGHAACRRVINAATVSVSALSDHLMGLDSSPTTFAPISCFSIRSFGSFDGTLLAGWLAFG